MKEKLFFIIFMSSVLMSAQNVIFNKIVKSSDNKDKVFYKIDSATAKNSQYLGELEVQGYSPDDVHTFELVYKKAKEIGANAFVYKPFEKVDGETEDFNPSNYKLNLYYLPTNQFSKENNVVYLINTSDKTQKISYNNDIIEFFPKTYIKKNLQIGEIYSISTRKIFGSGIKLAAKENQPGQYFQISSARIKANPYGTAGVNFKTGDIIMLEKSYADFLITIYKQIK